MSRKTTILLIIAAVLGLTIIGSGIFLILSEKSTAICGDGVCESAEQDDPFLCPQDCQTACPGPDCPEVKPSRPEACIDLYDPVCGKDGKTYSNECYAKIAGVEIEHKGVCTRPMPGPKEPEPKAEKEPNPSKKPPTPDVCFDLYDPVCGKDGKTYSNECYAKIAGVEIDYSGVCKKECLVNGELCSRDADCCSQICISASPGCPEGSFCPPPPPTCQASRK